MDILHALNHSLIHRLGWTIVHSAWQMAAVAVGLALILPAVRRRGTQASYTASCLALILTIVLPAATFPLIREPAAAAPTAPMKVETTAIRGQTIPGALKFEAASGSSSPNFAPPHGSMSHFNVPNIAGKIASPTPHKPKAWDMAATAMERFNNTMNVWLPWIVALWGAGIVVLSVWNVGGWIAAQRLKLQATVAVPSQVQEAALRIARQIGLTGTIRLLQSAVIDSPLVIGAIKPVILLPVGMLMALPTDQVEALLAHELAHVMRRDYFANLVQCVIETLMFYHPAVWWISKQIRDERENCCDDIAVKVTADRATYVKALTAVAGARTPLMATAAANGSLLARLQRILGIKNPSGVHPACWLTGIAMLSVCIGTLMLVALSPCAATAQSKTPKSAAHAKAQKQPEKPKEPAMNFGPQAATNGTMRIEVVDEAGKGIADATVRASIWTDEMHDRANRDYQTNSQGVTVIDFPSTLTNLQLWASKDGHCRKWADFNRRQAASKFEIPGSLRFHLPRGNLIGGFIRNEKGEPIAGVLVKAAIETKLIDPADNAQFTLSHRGTKTDASGKWVMADIPPVDGVKIRLKLMHPEYVSDQGYGELQKSQGITSESLRAQTASIAMAQGVHVAGKVSDPQGNPIEGAAIVWGNVRFDEERVVHTAKDGTFRSPALAPGKIVLTAVASGWQPATATAELTAKTSTVDFHLKRGKKLRLRVVDDAGAPVPYATVRIADWHGAETLHKYQYPPFEEIQIPRLTNADGVFEWNWAPEDTVRYLLLKPGYAEGEASLTADGSEQVQTIHRVLSISGSVRDAVTGQPIKEFFAIPVIHFSPSFTALPRNIAERQGNGRLSLDFDRTNIEHGVQIEAAGYRPFRTTRRYKVGEKNPVLDVQLQPAKAYKGRVVSRNGQPIPNARVYVASYIQGCEMRNLEDRNGEDTDNQSTNTDQNGGFEIPAQIDRYGVVVIAPGGYAEIDRPAAEQPGELRIQPWAKVTGRLVQSGKPVPNCEVYLRPICCESGDAPRINIRNYCTTAQDGSFVFDRVPPVPSQVRALLHWSAKSPLGSSHYMPLDLAPGKTVDVTLNGGARDVTGQLVIENAPPGFDYHFSISYLFAKKPGIKPPSSIASKGFDWKNGWSDSWTNSEEGGAYLKTLHHWFVKPEPDGHFRISGVEPGDYEFAVKLYGATEGCLVYPAAAAVIPVSVKPGSESVDLGKLTIPSIPMPQVGDLAPDFEFTASDGSKVNLAAMRGKFVLIDFWATWCAPCVAHLDGVESLRQKYAGTNHFVVIGANLDAETERAKEFLKRKPLPWQHALLGDWSSTDVPRQFGISGVPAYILIDPDGRIAADEFEFETMASKLKELHIQ